MSSPTFFGEGSSPRVSDTRWRILQKILGATIDGGGGGAGTDYLLDLANQAALPAAPTDPTKVWFASFRDGSAGKTWSPTTSAWY